MAGDPPPIPGTILIGPQADRRRAEVSQLLGCGRNFPGAQPVSFTKASLEALKTQDYYVCEKSDGLRFLMYCTTSELDEEREAVLLIDRKNSYYAIPRLHFPLPGDPTCKKFHTDTILDGELVLDIVNGQKQLVFLTFDMLMYQGKDLRKRNLATRLGRLKDQFLAPLHKFLKANPSQQAFFPFRMEFKYMQLGYGIQMMYRDIIPKLHHGNDGLIFTSQAAPYTSGTDETLLKWKPADENSIDFLLNVVFKRRPDGTEDFDTKPDFELYAFHSDDPRRPPGEMYKFYAQMYVSDAEYEQMKVEGAKRGGLHERVVECHLDKLGRWRFMRIRDDKLHGNHISVVQKVLVSIRDGVSMEELIAESYHIRKAYKERQALAAAK